jgi:hypothetical protein
MIVIQNNTDAHICYYEDYIYPDTLLIQNKPRLVMVSPQDYDFLESQKKWEKVLVPPQDTISIFFIRESVVNTYDWNEISIDYKILKRYDLSLFDLQSLNWTVTYPPTEDMKSIKQYPPYGSE